MSFALDFGCCCSKNVSFNAKNSAKGGILEALQLKIFQWMIPLEPCFLRRQHPRRKCQVLKRCSEATSCCTVLYLNFTGEWFISSSVRAVRQQF